jgi:hypothetical protein
MCVTSVTSYLTCMIECIDNIHFYQHHCVSSIAVLCTAAVANDVPANAASICGKRCCAGSIDKTQIEVSSV